MASFNGTISYEGAEPSQAHVDQAIRHAMDARMLKDQAGLSRVVKSYDLPDGAQVYVLDYEHVWKVHIVPPTGYAVETFEPPKPGETFPGDFASIAGLVSGVNMGSIMELKEIDWQFPDAPNAPQGEVPVAKTEVIDLMRETAELFTVDEVGHKLAIPPWVSFSQLEDETPRTQFHFIKPGHYTGAMAPLVQLFLGLGRQVDPDYEDRWVEADLDRRAKISLDNKMDRYGPGSGGSEATTGSDVSSYYQQEAENYKVYPRTTQISYDPRWNRTHGVIWGKDQDNKDVPFIVEVANRGVTFMPMVIDELSKTEKGRKQYLEVYPALAKYSPFKGGRETLFEAFGGFPIAENIPGDGDSYERAIRSGKVIRSDNDASSFYDGTLAMCTWFGWAFHPSKPRAANTGYRYQNGKKIGVCYEARFTVKEKSDSQKVRNDYYDQTVMALGLREELDLFKARRLPNSFALQMIESPDYDTFDEFEVEPDWVVTCKLHKLREGCIDYPMPQCPSNKPASFVESPLHPYFTGPMQTSRASGGCDITGSPHFKYYEPFLDVVVGFDFSIPTSEGRCAFTSADGPIFCTYTHKGIEILNYWLREATLESRSYNTRQYCQYTGNWAVGSEGQVSAVRGYFYSSSKDFRRTMSYGSGYRQDVTGHRSGYADFMSFCAYFAIHGTLRRVYYGYKTFKQKNWGSRDWLASVMCAANNRSAFFVVTEKIETGVTRGEGQGRNEPIGFSGYKKWGHLFHFHFHWTRFCEPADYPATDNTCRFTVHKEGVVDPESCFGTDPPADPGYSVCPLESRPSEPKMSTFDGKSQSGYHVYYSAYYNDHRAEVGEAWSEFSKPTSEFEWELWGMGLDLMNGRRLHSGREVFSEDADPQTIPIRASDTSWWRCSIPRACPSPRYFVGVNYYGKEFVSTYRDLGMSGIKTFGSKPSVPFSPLTIPFGVVE